MSEKLNIYIGYDEAEIISYHVAVSSIISRSSLPVSFTPISLKNISKFFTRKKIAKQSTDFAFSRFLTPYLSGYKGWSLFLDSDVIVLDDIAKLFKRRNDKYSVMVVKHKKYTPKLKTKFLNKKQLVYEKKNWSSVMLFNNSKCRKLTPDYVNTATGLQLHQFKWLTNENKIGELNLKWNFLVGEYKKIKNPSILHYTEGGPYFQSFKKCDYANDWFKEKNKMLSVKDK